MKSLTDLAHPKLIMSMDCVALLWTTNWMEVVLIKWSLCNWAIIQRVMGSGTCFNLRMLTQMGLLGNWNRRKFCLLLEKLEAHSPNLVTHAMDLPTPPNQTCITQIWEQKIYMNHCHRQIWVWLWVLQEIQIPFLVLLLMKQKIARYPLHSYRGPGLAIFCRSPQGQPLLEVWRQMLAWVLKYVLQGHLLKDGEGISCFPVTGRGLQTKSYSKYLESIHPTSFIYWKYYNYVFSAWHTEC